MNGSVLTAVRMDKVCISLVICTRNRAAYLPQHLASLSMIVTSIPWEIVFVDNNSTDETASILKAFAKNASMPVTVVHERNVGLSNARNSGWHAANGEVIAFTDDDCYPAADYIDALAKVFADTRMAFAGGRVLLHDPEDYPLTIKTSTQVHYYNPYSFIGPGHIHGANFAFRKALLETVAGFDALMGSGTDFPCEDCDVLLRALSVGAYGIYSPDIVVSHHHRRRAHDVPKIERAYMAGRGAFYMKALADANSRLPIVYEWMRSVKAFGLRSFIFECVLGVKYLLSRYRNKAATK